jgi:outer membrane protein OmpA-like peptidoglycan-associated protein
MKTAKLLATGLICSVMASTQPSHAEWDSYDDSQSNPLRVAAYLLHPIGWLAEWTIFRPFHLIVSTTEPQEAFFGHRPHPPLLAENRGSTYYYATAAKPPVNQAALQPKAPPPAPAAETVKIVEVPVEKIVVKEVIKEVPKVVEVEKLVFPAVAFAFNSANLTDLGKGQVYLAAQRLKEKTDVTVVIEGHADNRGGDDYNQKLGLQRAETVMNELAAQGIDRGRMSTASLGESRPLIGTDNAWAHAVNRRVEFQVKAAR